MRPKLILTWAAIAIVLGLSLWIVPIVQAQYFPPNIDSADVPALVNENRRTLAQIIGGFGLLIALYLASRRTAALERTVEVTEQGQITERFTRAIDQLGATDDDGNPKLEIRLGGIYALERIANDSPNRDYSTIMEVLTAYVRENAPRPQEVTSPTTAEPRADIQAILTVLGRRKKAGRANDVVLNLKATDLRGAYLEGAKLWRADLRRALLQRADLQRADLWNARLEGADLEGADLEGANVRGANLQLYVLAGDTTPLSELRKYTVEELSGRGLTQEQLDQTATGDEYTRLPTDLKPPAHWGVRADEQIEET